MKKWMRTFLYYLTAFAGGALLWAATFYLHARWTGSISVEGTEDPYYAIISVVPILLNILPQLVAAMILRKLARRFSWHSAWQWLLAGAAISVVVLFACAGVGLAVEKARLSLELQGPKTILLLILMGPIILTTKPLWLPAIPAAFLSLLLWAVEPAPKAAKT